MSIRLVLKNSLRDFQATSLDDFHKSGGSPSKQPAISFLGIVPKKSGTSCSGAWDTLRKPGPEIKAVHGPGNGRLPIPWFDRFTPSNMW